MKNNVSYWKCYNSIREIPEAIWGKVANGNVCLSYSFLNIIEHINPSDEMNYYLLYHSNILIGIGFSYMKRVNLVPGLKSFSIKLLMTGTFQTYGLHYWYDELYITENDFLNKFYIELKKKKPFVTVIRDYVEDEHDVAELSFFRENQFRCICPYSVALIRLDYQYANFDEYLTTLKKKHRNFYKKVLREREKYDLSVELRKKINIEQIYPLYLNVNAHAKEFKSKALPKEFFELIGSTMGSHTCCFELKHNGKLIGFILLFEDAKQVIPYLLGIDYNYRKENVWYNLTLEAIKYAITNNKKIIDLGLTSLDIKQRLGAKRHSINMYAKFENVVFNRLLGKFLNHIL